VGHSFFETRYVQQPHGRLEPVWIVCAKESSAQQMEQAYSNHHGASENMHAVLLGENACHGLVKEGHHC
jgi:hypothetical protein